MRAIELIGEMSMNAGSYEELGRYAPQFSSLAHSGEFAGDLETFRVYKAKDTTGKYAAFDDDNLIAFWQITSTGYLQGIYVFSQYRRKGLMSAILFFLKRNEGFSRIVIGEYQSNDTIEALKRIYKRFEKAYWEKDGQTMPYTPDTVDDFYSLTGPTVWKVVLEHNGTTLSKSKTFDPTDLGTWYFNLLE